MFADPQVVTVNAVARSMARILMNGTSATYQNSDESFKLTISHTKSGTRTRSMARLDQRKIVTDPLSSKQDYDTLSFYFVIDRPEYGFSQTEVEQLIAGLKTWLDNTAIGKLFGRES